MSGCRCSSSLAISPSSSTLKSYGGIIMPGLVNTHTHAAMTSFRGIADDLPLMEWLHEHIWPAEQAWVGADFVRDGAELAVAEMLRGGTTCFNDMYFFPDVVGTAASQAGIRASVGLIVIDFPTIWAGDAQEYLSKGQQVHDQFRDDPLITTAFAPHASYTVSDGPLAKIRTYAEELDIPIHIHLHESAAEIQTSLDAIGMRPLQRLEEMGLLSPRLMAVHMTQLESDEIKLAAHSGIQVVHCPESNLKLASGLCPVQRLLDAGVNVALGTDGAASNNDLDMLGEMRSAALLGKSIANDAAAVTAEDVLRMATLNGARALGLDEVTGSLEPGKFADMTAIDLSQIETQPVYHPLSQLVYAATRSQVTDVWVAGRHVLKQRQLTTLDEEGLRARAREWGRRIAASDRYQNTRINRFASDPCAKKSEAA